MDLVKEALTSLDLEKIDYYRRRVLENDDYFDTNSIVPIENILKPWAKAKKEYLYNLLGQRTIISQNITINQDLSVAMDKYASIGSSWFTSSFFEDLWDVLKGCSNYRETNLNLGIDALFSFKTLVSNIYNGETFTFGSAHYGLITIPKGAKILKVYRKIIDYKQIGDIKGTHTGVTFNEAFEKIRNWQSQARNQLLLKGQLCLSIHPLDYMTMSDNSCDWSSCMSWFEDGDYRQGTIEMMNSPCVVVAYLTASHDYVFGPTEYETWNNKKWRQLFIVKPECIIAIKGYPYYSEALTEEAINLIQDLAKKNLQWEYQPNFYHWHAYNLIKDDKGQLTNYSVSICPGGYMYNDMGTFTYHHMKIGTQISDYIDPIHYSGPSECMICGATNIDTDADRIGCYDCTGDSDDVTYCECCDRRIYYDDAYTFEDVDGYYCADCYSQLGSRCPCYQEKYLHTEMIPIIIVETNEKVLNLKDIDLLKTRLYRTYLCANCSRNIKENLVRVTAEDKVIIANYNNNLNLVFVENMDIDLYDIDADLIPLEEKLEIIKQLS